MSVHILGIRHHGPGSARNVKAFLEELRPDIVLVEGPPDADALLEWANHPELKPPVSILIYQLENPSQALFYPFSEFSPEWQAIQYAKRNQIPVRFMDLPIQHYFALEKEKSSLKVEEKAGNKNEKQQKTKGEDSEIEIPHYQDPISCLAEAAGFDDGEKWWEHQFEYRQNNEEVFEAVKEAMAVLRETMPTDRDAEREEMREAYMRKVIRQAEKDNFKNIAVICGAWHAPAITDLKNAKADNDLLKGLPKVKVECTWTPWTYGRLSFYTGYGAGIGSPGWYHHIWKHPKDNGIRWIVKVAKLLRSKRMDISVAHVIEAVRLAETLAILRNYSRPGLEEMNEAVLTVLCNGESLLLDLIHKELIVSNRIGSVPSIIPKAPLQLDIEKNQKKLKLPPTADSKEYVLDLRKDTDLSRSILLHRLSLLDIKWGTKQHIAGKGTFKEQWSLKWEPEISIDIIDKGSWGNTIHEAANKYLQHRTENSNSIIEIGNLLEQTIPAELPVSQLIDKINNLAAGSSDVIQLMEVIPNLVSISRYGNVRKTDSELVTNIAKSMITRICISLPSSCTTVNEDAASHLLKLFFQLNDSISILNDQEVTKLWETSLITIAFNQNTSPVIAGYTTRLLYDYKVVEGEKLISSFRYAMSTSNPPAISAAWLEGFLKGSGTILLLEPELWEVVNGWVMELDKENFTQVLPLLRRTFSEYSTSERRKLGEKVKSGSSTSSTNIKQDTVDSFDYERAKSSIPVVLQLLGIESIAVTE